MTCNDNLSRVEEVYILLEMKVKGDVNHSYVEINILILLNCSQSNPGRTLTSVYLQSSGLCYNPRSNFYSTAKE